MSDCPECDGNGWVGVAKPRCCGGSDWECGARGCTGPVPEWEQEQCEYCRGSGTVESDGEEIPPFDGGAEPVCANCKGALNDLEQGRDPEELCPTCYHDAMEALALPSPQEHQMDPNKRGNPPFEPSSYAAGLERRVKRCERWSSRAREAARWLLDGTDHEKQFAEQWWREQLNQPEVVLSSKENPA